MELRSQVLAYRNKNLQQIQSCILNDIHNCENYIRTISTLTTETLCAARAVKKYFISLTSENTHRNPPTTYVFVHEVLCFIFIQRHKFATFLQ